jgi:hypothetical protein
LSSRVVKFEHDILKIQGCKKFKVAKEILNFFYKNEGLNLQNKAYTISKLSAENKSLRCAKQISSVERINKYYNASFSTICYKYSK